MKSAVGGIGWWMEGLCKVRSEVSALSVRAEPGCVSNMVDTQVVLFLFSCFLLVNTHEVKFPEVPSIQHSSGKQGPQSSEPSFDSANEEDITQIDFEPPRMKLPKPPQSLLDALAEPIPPTLDRIPHDVFPYVAEPDCSDEVATTTPKEEQERVLQSGSSEKQIVIAHKQTVRSSHELETKIEIQHRHQNGEDSLQGNYTSNKDVMPHMTRSFESIHRDKVVGPRDEEEKYHSSNTNYSEGELLIVRKDTSISGQNIESEINRHYEDVQDSLQNIHTSKVTNSPQGNLRVHDNRMCAKCQQNDSQNHNCHKCSSPAEASPSRACGCCCSKCRKCCCPPLVQPCGGCCADCKAKCLRKLGRCAELAKTLGERVAASASRVIDRIKELQARHGVEVES